MKQIYLDNSATTPIDESVMKKLHTILTEGYGNASSQHQIGRKAKEFLELARKRIAKEINAEPEEIIFTSGGTESNNLAIQGLAHANPNKKHIITTIFEHPAVLEVCRFLEKQGYKIDYLKVNHQGFVDLEDLKKTITPQTLLVSIMHVNNEIGTIQPIEEIAKLCKEKQVYFHTDAVQSFGKLKIDVKKTNIDLLSASGHKLNSPKGIGILYIRNGVKISPLFYGGGQERGLRSGTENLAGALGLAYALDIKRNKQQIENSRNRLLKEILKIKGSKLNGSLDNRIYNNLHVSFYGIEGEGLMLLLDKAGICVSTGSACSSTKLQESHVLKAIGVEPLYIHGSIRITLDTRKALTSQEIKFISTKIKEAVEKLRKMSPFKLE